MPKCPRCGNFSLFIQEEYSSEPTGGRLWDATCSCGFNECSLKGKEDLDRLLEEAGKKGNALKKSEEREAEIMEKRKSKKERGEEIEQKIEEMEGKPFGELLRAALGTGKDKERRQLIKSAGAAGSAAPIEFIHSRLRNLDKLEEQKEKVMVIPVAGMNEGDLAMSNGEMVKVFFSEKEEVSPSGSVKVISVDGMEEGDLMMMKDGGLVRVSFLLNKGEEFKKALLKAKVQDLRGICLSFDLWDLLFLEGDGQILLARAIKALAEEFPPYRGEKPAGEI